jgi:hypothetical protein
VHRCAENISEQVPTLIAAATAALRVGQRRNIGLITEEALHQAGCTRDRCLHTRRAASAADLIIDAHRAAVWRTELP